MSRLRLRLTYANVMATIAVFIALGGASYAALKLPKNSVGAKQIKKEAVTAAKVKKGTLTGTQINASTLGMVPSAANAQTLGGQSASQISEAARVRCPSGTIPSAGVCFEAAERKPPTDLLDAMVQCSEFQRTTQSRMGGTGVPKWGKNGRQYCVRVGPKQSQHRPSRNFHNSSIPVCYDRF